MNTRVAILKLLADGQFHSGTDIGQELGVSRTAVCKGIKTLTAHGLEIRRVTGRGYQLAHPLQPLDRQLIERHLRALQISHRAHIEILEEVDSTNRFVFENARAEQSGWVCLAEVQSRGRGRYGRHWLATPYRNLVLSMAWLFPAGPGVITGLSLAAGTAVLKALGEYGISNLGLKWPNDVMHRGRKLAGVLIDIRGEAAGPALTALGVGINAQLDAAHGARIDQPWIDIASITGQTVDRNRLAAHVIARLWEMFGRFAEEGFAPFRKEWERHDVYRGQRARLIQGEREIEGTVEGVDETGALRLCDARGHRWTFHSGEISLRKAS
jgi:BirA family biotin operon repressor/biotin-[acetyl-CoA-carboxylase] ligase